jgi:hypothetical protein
VGQCGAKSAAVVHGPVVVVAAQGVAPKTRRSVAGAKASKDRHKKDSIARQRETVDTFERQRKNQANKLCTNVPRTSGWLASIDAALIVGGGVGTCT